MIYLRIKYITKVLVLGTLSACGGNVDHSNSFSSGAREVSNAAMLSGGGLTEKQKKLNTLAEHLHVRYTVLENRRGETCPIKSPCYFSEIALTLPFDSDDSEWRLYFSQLDAMTTFTSDEFRVETFSGDLKRVVPNENFSGFQAGVTKKLVVQMNGDHINEFKPMPNLYVAYETGEYALVESTIPVSDPETGLEKMPHLTSYKDEVKHFISRPNDKNKWARSSRLYDSNKDAYLDTSSVETAIIPAPKQVSFKRGRYLDLINGINPELKGLPYSDLEAALKRLNVLGIKESLTGVPLIVNIEASSKKVEGAYSMDINDSGIHISASTAQGAFYGVQSLASLLTYGNSKVPQLSIEDEPRFGFRGMHIDVSRNFRSKEFILDMLEQMAAYKLNKLHFHLSDDEGWRLEIDGLPELTEIGAYRCHDPEENVCILPQLGSGPNRESTANGYFSKEDYKEILRAAGARHIEVIPSFDMPGHSRAAVKAMEARYRKWMAKGDETAAKEFLLTELEDKTVYRSIQNYNDNTINVCIDSAYTFMEKVIDEVVKMHDEAKHPLRVYHIGADESPGAWKDSPACKKALADGTIENESRFGSHFIERIAKMLEKRGIIAAAWSDGMEHADHSKLPPVVQSNVWDLIPAKATAVANLHANRGWDVVLSIPDATYLDMPHEADPKERGYDWAARQLNSRKVFEFMPENLPIHAEFWKDVTWNDFEVNDHNDDAGEHGQAIEILKQGKSYRGMQGQLWGETLRSDTQAEYMAFPRLLVLAEKAWHRAEWEVPYNYDGGIFNKQSGVFKNEMRKKRDKAWNNFANVLAHKELLKLDIQGIEYRIPTVGAKIENGYLVANIIFPGLKIEYREPGKDWKEYKGRVKLRNSHVEVRAVAADGIRKGRSLKVM